LFSLISITIETGCHDITTKCNMLLKAALTQIVHPVTLISVNFWIAWQLNLRLDMRLNLTTEA